ncbi:CoA ester lyase [Nitratireductor sp. ZSWI3]|uniref:HpcH/HpaI aldolase/citrate lyase family protein n=1 Tax=Nitratireductor sp. ZSWI3 TaxID=2966359 RepID=UPI00214FDDEE|nr:CoA ester lyase [Nitratireductor sp. ZSWI3]MCR4265389.1 CoA ester lyase [Nitratireductor sp. ZSWI3]
MTAQQDHSWRSLLYVPGNNERFIARAQSRGAGAIVLDLEDSVPDDRKAEARDMTAAAIGDLREGPSRLMVRINGGLRLAVPDLEAVVQPGLAALFVPKCEAGEKLRLISDLVSELEAERGMPVGAVGLVAMIESPRGLHSADRIACADRRVRALILGSEDFATAAGMMPTPEALLLPRQQIVFAARAAGIVPLGLLDSVANYRDAEHVAAVAQRARAFGFRGATCVHPNMVPILNAAFRPSAAETDWARGVLHAMDAAHAAGRGAAVFEGRMVDKPMLDRAREILASDEAS